MDQATKTKARLDVNLSLLAICFTILALIISINPALLKQTFLISIQLAVAIPMLISSIFARSKLVYTQKAKLWEEYGFFTFLLGYSCLINSLGILLSEAVDLQVGLVFFAFNIISPIVYSTLETVSDASKIRGRVVKDLFFILFIIFGGILPSLGVY